MIVFCNMKQKYTNYSTLKFSSERGEIKKGFSAPLFKIQAFSLKSEKVNYSISFT